MSLIKIEKEDVLLVSCISGLLPFQSGKKKEAGLSYRRYAYNGKVFISDDEAFNNSLEKGGVATITLDLNGEDQLSMTGYITFAKLVGLKKNTLLLESLTVENYKPEAVDFAALVG